MVRTKSSSAHGTTKEKGEMRGRSLCSKRRGGTGRFFKWRGVNWKKSSKLGTHLFMLAVMHCRVWVITTIEFWFLISSLSSLLSAQHSAYSWLDDLRTMSMHIKCLSPHITNISPAKSAKPRISTWNNLPCIKVQKARFERRWDIQKRNITINN